MVRALRSIMARVVTGEPVAAILNEDIDPEFAKHFLPSLREQLYTPEEAAIGLCQILSGCGNPCDWDDYPSCNDCWKRVSRRCIRKTATILEEQKLCSNLKPRLNVH